MTDLIRIEPDGVQQARKVMRIVMVSPFTNPVRFDGGKIRKVFDLMGPRDMRFLRCQSSWALARYGLCVHVCHRGVRILSVCDFVEVVGIILPFPRLFEYLSVVRITYVDSYSDRARFD